MQLDCPGCGVSIQVPEARERTRVSCPHCAQAFQLQGRKILFVKGESFLCRLCHRYSIWRRPAPTAPRQPHDPPPMPHCTTPGCQREYVEWQAKYTAAGRKWNSEWARLIQLDEAVFQATLHENTTRVNFEEGPQTRKAEELVRTRRAAAEACQARANELYLDVESLVNNGPFVILQSDTEVEIAVAPTPAADPVAAAVSKLVRAGLSPEELERELGRLMGQLTPQNPKPRVVNPD